MPMARPTMLASARGEFQTAVAAELGLEAGGEFEDAAFALEFAGAEGLVAGGVGYVFAEDDDAGSRRISSLRQCD